MIHILKTDPPYFDAIWGGAKTFEVRRNDRDFKVGDELCLKEHDRRRDPGRYTGRVIDARITYLTTYAQQEGMVVLGIKVTGRHKLPGPWSSSTAVLAGALRELALQVDSLDGVPNATMLEAAQRLLELQTALDHAEALAGRAQVALRTFHGRARDAIVNWMGENCHPQADMVAVVAMTITPEKCPACGIPWSEAERCEMVRRNKMSCLCGFTREVPARIPSSTEGGE